VASASELAPKFGDDMKLWRMLHGFDNSYLMVLANLQKEKETI
jgi:hypothetical protein